MKERGDQSLFMCLLESRLCYWQICLYSHLAFGVNFSVVNWFIPFTGQYVTISHFQSTSAVPNAAGYSLLPQLLCTAQMSANDVVYVPLI